MRLILQETVGSPFTDSYLVKINGRTAVLKRAGSYPGIDLTGDLENATLTGADLEGPESIGRRCRRHEARGVEGACDLC